MQTIVNVIEPDHGTVFDPACGSGGMFVQSSHFIERQGGDTAQKVVFYGQEKNRDTIRIAKMNLAVHGLEGKIAEAITYYQDEHNLAGKCDFVMANPPFNVDLVDAERIKDDPRLPFGLPGVNKSQESLQRQLPLDFLFLELPERKGPRRLRHVVAGVQRRPWRKGGSPQDRRDRRRGRDDLHPLEFFLYPHRALRAVVLRPRQAQILPSPSGRGAGGEGGPLNAKGRVLMIDARNVFRKGEPHDQRFLARTDGEPFGRRLVVSRAERPVFGPCRTVSKTVAAECIAAPAAIEAFEATLAQVQERIRTLSTLRVRQVFHVLRLLVRGENVVTRMMNLTRSVRSTMPWPSSARQSNPTRKTSRPCWPTSGSSPRGSSPGRQRQFAPSTRAARRLTRSPSGSRDSSSRSTLLRSWPGVPTTKFAASWPSFRTVLLTLRVRSRMTAARWRKLLKQLEDERHAAVEQLRHAVYFHRQAAWLLDRFPEGKLVDVPGLVKLVTKAESRRLTGV